MPELFHLTIILLFISVSFSADVCSDGLELACDGDCRLSVTIGSLTPTCHSSVPLATWTKNAPLLFLDDTSCDIPTGKKVGLLMTDPDAPNCAVSHAKYWLHWLVLDANLNGKSIDLSSANVIAPFAPPTPPQAPAGLPPYHRYQFTVFAYTGVSSPITTDGVKSAMKDRKNFRDLFQKMFQNYETMARTEFKTKQGA